MYMLLFLVCIAGFIYSCSVNAAPKFLYHSVLLRKPSLQNAQQPPIVILHGLLGSSRNFQSWSRLLSQKMRNEHDIIVMDLRCHGRSVAHGDLQLEFEQMAEDVIFTMEKLNLNKVHLIGHSLGGKVAARTGFTLQQQSEPRNIEVLSTTMMDISPIKYDCTDFKDVLSTIDFLSATKESFAQAKSRQGALSIIQAAFEDKVLQQFLLSNLQSRTTASSSSSSSSSASSATSLNGAESGFEWKFLVDGIHMSRDSILEFPLPSGGPSILGHPVLILKGSKSKFIKSSHMKDISSLFPLFTLATIDAGHWLHMEAPEASAAAIAKFLDNVQEYHARREETAEQAKISSVTSP